MRIKTKNLNWSAGRPVVIMGDEIAKKLNIRANDRVSIKYNDLKIHSVVDIFPNIVHKNEIGLSKEIVAILNTSKNDVADIGTSNGFVGSRIVRKKLHNEKLSHEEIRTLIDEISSNNLTEAEIAYFISAEKIYGMSTNETISLVDAMVKSGKTINFGNKIVADKHCIGGIAGNRTTPIVVSICAAAGLTIPKSSSRAITSASGTADVIETIANVELSLDEIKKIVDKTGGCLVWGGALGLAPSDDKIIRVERMISLDVEPQLLASILSKKIAAGSNHIIIDIPYGGGKIKKLYDAKKLGKKFEKISRHFGLKLKVIYTRGELPIGNGFGPVLEMKDVLSVLKNEKNCPTDLKEKSIFLSSELMSLCGISNPDKIARKILESGKAYEKFKEIINEQNGSNDFDSRVSKLKLSKHERIVYSTMSGKISHVSNHKINAICRMLGTPETSGSGVYLHKSAGGVTKGEKLMTLYSENENKIADAIKYINESYPIEIR